MRRRLGILLGVTGILASCVAAFPPVEVTRFHLASTITPGKLRIESSMAPSAEALTYVTAVSGALAKQGFPIAALGDPATYAARIAFSRATAGPTTNITLTVLLNDTKGDTVWEGRAKTSARVNSPATQPGLVAQKLADALFAGFPGESGKTITVP